MTSIRVENADFYEMAANRINELRLSPVAWRISMSWYTAGCARYYFVRRHIMLDTDKRLLILGSALNFERRKEQLGQSWRR